MTLNEALQVFIAEHIGDLMSDQIRDHEELGWDGPRVLNFSKALKVIKQHLADSEDK